MEEGAGPAINFGWQHAGILGIIIVVFGLVIRYLFNRYEKREETIAVERDLITKERASWVLEREKIRGEFEAKHSLLVTDFAQKIVKIQDEAREHEDKLRRDHADELRSITDSARRANESLTEMLQKFYDRMTTRPPRGGGY